ncbi:putative pyridoxine 5'-phosphate oxidase superfamily flavin-nucleotide-binding protein [Geodermatophilus bullaregiensis]|uniref:pyridoxamine 5'-phosphate oxidase family protein n=1 Tax=Geodermatophilus bullaregiensis TaxID=1564160 RepID=UPI00195DD34E|nr:pyridoxamine 5'-phosphate oxidase family protein [Geodermatophilus bullaregiensis]MBM7807519.1 putative pyridoxine 5'-phosphate oxidase superfamily flavin-nucleotide-binding protein [Geodermatophilus bullaregiensis]
MPGSIGEHVLQERYGTVSRARGFYDHQVLDHLNERMQAFVARAEMVFVATADSAGEADCSFRAGEPGFVRVLDERRLLCPEYRGNGVMASLGNIIENGHVGLLFIDFCGDGIGLHVNGRARLSENAELLARAGLPDGVLAALGQQGGRRPECWVAVDVVEAYVHCSKHIPRLVPRPAVPRARGTDDVVRTGGDFFRAKHSPRPWVDGDADLCERSHPA